MYSNQDAVEMFNQMVSMGFYYDSGRPVTVEPSVILQDICSKIPVTKNEVILDVGCGTGVITLPLSKCCRWVHGLDAGEKVLAAAQERCQQEGISNVTYHLGSALQLPFEDKFFDHVLMYAVIHYLENGPQVMQCVKELVRVCKPGGHILIAEIPDQQSRLEFDRKPKTKEELRILEAFNANRAEYDGLFKEHVSKLPAPNGLILDCQAILEEGKKLGCEGKICKQDIRQPFSLTRKDVLLRKK